MMKNHMVPFNKWDAGLSLVHQTDNFLTRSYINFLDYKLEIEIFIAKLIHILNEVAPKIIVADLVNIAITFVSSIGLSSEEESEAVQWLLSHYSQS